MITQKELKKILDYNLETGVFVWKEKISDKIIIGKIAGTNSHGYVAIAINKKKYRAHRLAWLYVYGYFPEQIDHINQIKNDNKISNLRIATNSQNQANTKIRKNNKTGYKGVSIHKKSNKFVAFIRLNGKTKNLGYFNTAIEASNTYKNLANQYFGEFKYV